MFQKQNPDFEKFMEKNRTVEIFILKITSNKKYPKKFSIYVEEKISLLKGKFN